MGEVLDMSKGKLGLNKDTKQQGDTEKKTDAITELEQAIQKIENIDARELLQSKADLLKAEMDAKTREAQERARRYGGNGGAREVSERGEREKNRQEMVVNALLLLERGVDPDTVARFITGSSSPNIPITLGGGGQPGITIQDITTLFAMMKENTGGDTELRATVKALNETVASLSKQISEGGASRGAPDLVSQVESTVSIIERLRDLGFIPREGSGGSPGEPLENIKEKHRHEEKMEEIKTERNFREGMVDTAGNIVEDIGHGASSSILKRKEVPKRKTGGVLETFECQNCGDTIYVTPENKNKVTCSGCGWIYERGSAEE